MATDLIQLMGFEVEKDIKIIFTGLRPGEKLYEELITEGEGIVPTKHEKIMVLRGGVVVKQDLELMLNQLKKRAQEFDMRGIKNLIIQVIPEYVPDVYSESIIGRRCKQIEELRN
jgi:FlaA1/EpsC-like NDP-sugar epimerase